MTEAFKHRQEMLHDCLMTFQDPDVPPSTGLKLVDTADIAKLQAVLREAEACFELYEHFDDGIHPPCAELQAKIDARKLAELGVEPVPSRIKVRAWSQLRVARTFLAHAYEAIGAHEEALPLFRLQVEQTLRMRDETWDKKNIFHSAINNLVCCLIHSGKFEEAKEWNDRGLHFCEQEDPESPMHKSFKHNLAVMAGRKAGPAQGSGDEPSGKARKKCWNCGTVECAATKLLRCSKCDDLKVATPAYYCSKECQQNDWARHKLFHRWLKKSQKESDAFHVRDVDLHQHRQTPGEDEYTKLLIQALDVLEKEGNMKKARRLFEKAIKIDPENPVAHYNLANLFTSCNNPEGVIKEFEEVMRICDHTESFAQAEVFWSEAASSIYATCHDDSSESALVDKPTWVTGDPSKLLEMAKRACQGAPDDYHVWFMRAGAAEAVGELGQASKFYRKGRDVSDSQEVKDSFTREIERVRGLQQKQQRRRGR